AVADWVNARNDLCGLAVCGSWARGNPRPDSDLDLIVLAREPSALATAAPLAAIDFAAAGFQVSSIQQETYGAVCSWHLHLFPAADLELTIAGPAWAAIAPVDDGTRAVLRDAFRVVVDKARLLQDLIAAVRDRPLPMSGDKDATALVGIDA